MGLVSTRCDESIAFAVELHEVESRTAYIATLGVVLNVQYIDNMSGNYAFSSLHAERIAMLVM
jgi:hypothetical protein